LNPLSFFLPLRRDFRWADVVHCQILQRWDFNLLSLPLLTRMRPTVWTIHDVWPLSGHCNYPLTCEKWKTHCRECPRLDLFPAMKIDKTELMFSLKRRVYRHSNFHVVVSSKWMERIVSMSPLMAGREVHRIPFGLDLESFAPRDPMPARKRLGIPPENVVLAFRAEAGVFKGFNWILQALRQLKPMRPITLLTVESTGNLNEFLGKHQLVELGWINEESTTRDFFAAADIFLMPSDAESFGLMAIEAMASGKPVIVMDGTSLPEVVFADTGGYSFKRGEVSEFVSILDRLIANSNERERRGEVSRMLAEEHYDIRLQAHRLAELYQHVHGRSNRREAEVSG